MKASRVIKKTLTGLVASLALLVSATHQAQAAVLPTLGISLTLYAQGEEETDDDGITKGKIEKAKAATKDLLEFVADVKEVPNEAGNYIEVDPEGGVKLKNSDGEDVADLSDIIQVVFNFEESLFSGTVNQNNDKERSKSLVTMSLHIGDENGTDLTMSGIATVSFSHSGENEDGEYKASASVTATVSGSGQFEGENVLVQGKVTLKGKEVVKNP